MCQFCFKTNKKLWRHRNLYKPERMTILLPVQSWLSMRASILPNLFLQLPQKSLFLDKNVKNYDQVVGAAHIIHSTLSSSIVCWHTRKIKFNLHTVYIWLIQYKWNINKSKKLFHHTYESPKLPFKNKNKNYYFASLSKTRHLIKYYEISAIDWTCYIDGKDQW